MAKTPPRKLAEIWAVGKDYQLRVVVGAFQRGLTPDAVTAEQIATYEVMELLRKILREHDANTLELRSDNTLPPPEA